MSIRSHAAGTAEAVCGNAGCDQGWDSIEGAGASGGDVAQAIGTEEGGSRCTTCDTEQRGGRHGGEIQLGSMGYEGAQ